MSDDLGNENAKLRELVTGYAKAANFLCERWEDCDYCGLGMFTKRYEKCELGKLNDVAKELGMEVTDDE